MLKRRTEYEVYALNHAEFRLLNKNQFDIELIKRRGGIFACLASIYYNIPQMSFRENKIILSILLILICPLIFLLLFIDKLDKYKEFTHGYDILAKKQKYGD